MLKSFKGHYMAIPSSLVRRAVLLAARSSSIGCLDSVSEGPVRLLLPV